jgi:hypothetical protein
MKSDVVPDITMRGRDDPHGRAASARPPTVGQLAGGLRDLAGRRADWQALIRFDPARPSRVRLDAETGAFRWLTTWPPGHRAGPPTDHTDHTDRNDHDGHGTEVTTLVAGELVEVTIGPEGVTERPMRAGRTRVHGAGAADDTRELHNPGTTYAITLHARPR